MNSIEITKTTTFIIKIIIFVIKLVVFDSIVYGINWKTAGVLYSEDIFLQFWRLQEKHPILINKKYNYMMYYREFSTIQSVYGMISG
jgi:hypothetical protein